MDKHRMEVVEYSKRQVEIVEEGTETHVAFLNNDRCGKLLAHWIVGCCNREVIAIERRRRKSFDDSIERRRRKSYDDA